MVLDGVEGSLALEGVEGSLAQAFLGLACSGLNKGWLMVDRD